MTASAFIEKMKDIRKMIYLPYYYVPECPECGSRRTGRYVRYHAMKKDDDSVVKLSLKNGEIVDFLAEIDDVNVFCMDCGHEWYYDVEMSFKNLDEIAYEKRVRRTNELLTDFMKQQKGKGKKKGLFHTEE